MEKILNRINEEYLYSLVHVDRETGLRRGELLALKFEDINFSKQNLYIKRAVEEICGEGLNFKDTKNKSGFRNIYVDKETINILKSLKKHHLKVTHEKNLVFTFNDGNQIRSGYVTKRFKKFLRYIGFRRP
jgi:integrase